MAARRIAVIVGCGSKHDKDGVSELPPTVRFGLGGALSITFAQSRSFDHVLLLSRRQDLLELVAAEVKAAAGADSVSTMVCDVTNDASVKAAFDHAASLGSVECVVFNASAGFPTDPATGAPQGYGAFPAPAAVDPAQLTQAFDVSVSGCVRVASNCIPYFLAQGRGSLIVSGATLALRGGAGFACASPLKFALRSYCQVSTHFPTLEATQGQTASQTPTDATSKMLPLRGSICMGVD